ncbi:AarF/ABC1/UbiB kinase family protein [bacterium]|nr:AarF/ABC1/UbiB kinase family protein [bacterium]
MPERSRSILETYNCLVRYKEILAILVKYGYKDLLMKINPSENKDINEVLKDGNTVPPESVQALSGAERFRLLLESLGTTFIKFGQILSTRNDILPEDYCAELKKLQDKVPPFPDEDAKAIIKEELGKTTDELFQSFSDKPVACASIAQVYKATLPSGEIVAIKIRRPNIEKRIQADLAIMEDLSRLLEKYVQEARAIRPTTLVREFGRQLQQEMNLLVEANNLERFNILNQNESRLKLVKLYRDLSTSHILTMEFVTGTKISNTEKLRSLNLDLKTIAKNGASVIISQIFDQGFYHGDPHPGNILVQDDGRICFLDFGAMGKLTKEQRMLLAEGLVAVVRRRDDELLRVVLKLSSNGDDIKDTKELGRDISDFVDTYAYLPLNRIKVDEILNDLMKLLTKHGIILPPEISTLVKVLAMLDGTYLAIDPDFQVMEVMKPYAQKLVLEKFDPKRLASDMTHTSAELYRLLRDLPDEARSIIKTIKKAELKVSVSSGNLKQVLRTFDKDANRLSYALIVSALLLASALLLHTHTPPVWHEVSILGIVGLIASATMGLWLLIAIARSGHL